MNKKQCPLKAMGSPCSKENCAWYLVHSKQCAVPLIASALKNMAAPKLIQMPALISLSIPFPKAKKKAEK